jgi:DNA-3-methyladenine glycosylase II
MTAEALTKTTLARAARLLARRDPNLAAILKRLGPPPLWARPPGFATLVKIILEQQVSLASAASMFARLQQNIVPFQPARLTQFGEPSLKSLGLTRQKTAYCLALAQSLTEKRLRLAQVARMNDQDAKDKLMTVKGLGDWSADVYLLMALRRPDVWPVKDLALAQAVADVKQLARRPGHAELLAIAEGWRPYRSVAARMLWQHYLARRAGNQQAAATTGKRANGPIPKSY